MESLLPADSGHNYKWIVHEFHDHVSLWTKKKKNAQQNNEPMKQTKKIKIQHCFQCGYLEYGLLLCDELSFSLADDGICKQCKAGNLAQRLMSCSAAS